MPSSMRPIHPYWAAAALTALSIALRARNWYMSVAFWVDAKWVRRSLRKDIGFPQNSLCIRSGRSGVAAALESPNFLLLATADLCRSRTSNPLPASRFPASAPEFTAIQSSSQPKSRSIPLPHRYPGWSTFKKSSSAAFPQRIWMSIRSSCRSGHKQLIQGEPAVGRIP